MSSKKKTNKFSQQVCILRAKLDDISILVCKNMPVVVAEVKTQSGEAWQLCGLCVDGPLHHGGWSLHKMPSPCDGAWQKVSVEIPDC